MSCFIQSLESRRLLTATTASIDAETAAIATNLTTVKADLIALKTSMTADFKAVVTDLKSVAKTNLPALKKFQVDEKILLSHVGVDVAALLKGSTVANKGAADGKAVIANPSLANKMQADVDALAKADTTPLAKLITDADHAAVDADIDALVAANPTITALPPHAATAKSDISTKVATLLADSTAYSNALKALNTDLTTLLPAPTTTPSLIGDYKGSIKTKGVIFGIGGQNVPLEIIVTSQTLTTLGGSITVDNNTATGTITVTELSTGKVTFDIDNSGIVGHMVGSVNVKTTPKGFAPGTVISGSGSFTIDGNKISGSFSLTKIT